MKYAIAFALVFSGCATVTSEYNQGCQDGLSRVRISPDLETGPLWSQEDLKNYCNDIESERREKAPHGRQN